MKCPVCGYENKEIDYFEIINNLKKDFYKKNGNEATHLIVGIEEYYNMENSKTIIDRLIYIKDTVSNGALGSYILGLKVIKTKDIKGMRIGYFS